MAARYLRKPRRFRGGVEINLTLRMKTNQGLKLRPIDLNQPTAFTNKNNKINVLRKPQHYPRVEPVRYIARLGMQNIPPLEQLLVREYGVIVGASAVAHLLGYGTPYALAKARSRGQLPVQTFRIPGRRGWFARTAEIAGWLDSLPQNDGREGAAMS